MSKRYARQGKPISQTVIPDLRRASHFATDKATKFNYQTTRNKIRAVGLGGLSRAIGSTSSLKKRKTAPGDDAWGAIYAKGGQNSRANAALEAYTKGAKILPTGGRKWLAYPTKAAGRLVRKQLPRIGRGRSFGNFKNSPSRLGMQLKFVPLSASRAMLILDDAVVNNKTGKAKRRGQRTPRNSIRKKYVVMFWLIRYTTRASRFSQDRLTKNAAQQIPFYVQQYQNRKLSGP